MAQDPIASGQTRSHGACAATSARSLRQILAAGPTGLRLNGANEPRSPMKRTLILLFGLTGYAVFHATFLYLIAFVTGLYAPLTVDRGGNVYFGAGVMVARSSYSLWIPFSQQSALIVYPRLSAGYGF